MVCVARKVRNDNILRNMRNYVRFRIEQKHTDVSDPIFQYKGSWYPTNCCTPLLLVKPVLDCSTCRLSADPLKYSFPHHVMLGDVDQTNSATSQ